MEAEINKERVQSVQRSAICSYFFSSAEAKIYSAPGAEANKGRRYYCIIDKDTFIEISIFININTDQ